ncbi:MAG: cation diffusion facilitator family transporter [Gammaproteobacteria bacterium]|nr:cation diffusion facilitator family transporter [Gammaproteobacteria bacterium]
MGHNHAHAFGEERNRQTKIVAIVGSVVNLVLAVVKIIFGYIGHSQALIVDGIHSLSDLLSDLLVLFASHHANQEPDAEHPYGHGRFETAATLALGILLALVGIGIGWDSVERLLLHEETVVPTQLALYAALFSIIANEGLYWYSIIIARKLRSKMLEANAWHHRSDAVSSIVVLVGIVGTQFGIENLDTIAAVIVSLMIIKIGWSLGWQALEELVDKSLDEDEVAKVSKLIDNVDGVHSLHMLRTRKSGHLSAADVHVLVDPGLSVSEGHMIAVAVEDKLKNNVDHLSDITVHIDPENDEEAPPCKGLPLRSEVVTYLREKWRGIDCFSEETDISLHYLSGKINIDVIFQLGCYQSAEITADKRRELTDALQNDDRFGAIEIFYKAP